MKIHPFRECYARGDHWHKRPDGMFERHRVRMHYVLHNGISYRDTEKNDVIGLYVVVPNKTKIHAWDTELGNWVNVRQVA